MGRELRLWRGCRRRLDVGMALWLFGDGLWMGQWCEAVLFPYHHHWRLVASTTFIYNTIAMWSDDPGAVN
jgi:hypothetical protein